MMSFTTLHTWDPVAADHFHELREAMNAARAALGLTTPLYTDLDLAGAWISLHHIDELRQRSQ
jgi:hypothetical protein